MKLNKSAYLFAAALVAGTVGMTSCSSEEVIDATEQGVENKVTLALSVADKFGTRSTADEVNLGDNLQPVANVTVVPMIGTASLNPIAIGDLNPGVNNGTVEKITPLNSLVNAFKVYGNVPAESFDATKAFPGFTISTTKIEGIQGIGGSDLYNPHKLYYYGYAKAGEKSIYVGDNFATATTELAADKSVGSSKYVKITGINYAVGVLAAAVLNGDKNTVVYSKNGSDNYVETADKAGDQITLKGIFFDNQKQEFDEDFNAQGTDISVYSEACKTTFADQAVSFSDSKIKDANYYVIANATTNDAQDWVKGNFVFTLAAGKYIKVGAGNTDADFIGGENATTIYLSFQLQPKDGKAVFAKDYTTIINATVKNWGLASDTPIEVTDATIGVVIDMTWQEGLQYDVEI